MWMLLLLLMCSTITGIVSDLQPYKGNTWYSYRSLDSSYMWYSGLYVGGLRSLYVDIMGCQDASIIMSTLPDAYTHIAYEFMVDRSNSQTCLRSPADPGTYLTCSSQVNIISCDEWRPLWMSWETSTLRMGEGSDKSQRELFAYTLGSAFEALYLSYGNVNDANAFRLPGGLNACIVDGNNVRDTCQSTAANEAECLAAGCCWDPFNISKCFVKPEPVYMAEHTQANLPFSYAHVVEPGLDVSLTNHLVFEAKACRDIHVYFPKVPGVYTVESYMIGIGNYHNSRVLVRPYKTSGDTYSTAYLSTLNCDEYRSFWITWDSVSMQIGLGYTPGVNQVIDMIGHTMYHFQQVALGSEGNWGSVRFPSKRNWCAKMSHTTPKHCNVTQIPSTTREECLAVGCCWDSRDSSCVIVSDCEYAYPTLLNETQQMNFLNQI